MPLNKSSGNMYPWITHTWNAVKGACPHGCSYCYMNKIYRRFGKTPGPLHLDERELKTDLGSGNFIFAGSSTDIFSENIPASWISGTGEVYESSQKEKSGEAYGMTGQCCDNCANYRDCLTQFMYNGGLLGTECAAWTEKETDRGRFERENYYQPSAVRGKGCLSCCASFSVREVIYDILHCSEIPVTDDAVEADFVCGLWNNGGLL